LPGTRGGVRLWGVWSFETARPLSGDRSPCAACIAHRGGSAVLALIVMSGCLPSARCEGIGGLRARAGHPQLLEYGGTVLTSSISTTAQLSKRIPTAGPRPPRARPTTSRGSEAPARPRAGLHHSTIHRYMPRHLWTQRRFLGALLEAVRFGWRISPPTAGRSISHRREGPRARH